LSAASPYFKAMFTGGLKESEMTRVKLQGVCVSSMARILNFMYTGRINVTEVTVCQLLPAATMFQVTYVIEACCAFLERQLDPQNGKHDFAIFCDEYFLWVFNFQQLELRISLNSTGVHS
jgi:kelch-like protein 19